MLMSVSYAHVYRIRYTCSDYIRHVGFYIAYSITTGFSYDLNQRISNKKKKSAFFFDYREYCPHHDNDFAIAKYLANAIYVMVGIFLL